VHGVEIAGIGISMPPTVIDNQRIAEILLEQRQKVLKSGIELTAEQMEQYESSNDWIVERSGINERRFAAPHETTSDYAARSGHAAWTDAFGDGLEIPDFLLLATVSPDHFTTPTTSVATHRKMGIPVSTKIGGLHRLIARDITQACSSFAVALQDGVSLIKSGECQCGLVNGSDLMTRVMSWNRRSPFVILGDGSGTIVLKQTSPEQSWFGPRAFFAGVNGGLAGMFEQMIINRAGGAALPTQIEHLDPRVDAHMMFMDGREVFKHIVRMVSDEIIPSALAYAGLVLEQIDIMILHQANMRMVEAIVKRLVTDNPSIAVRMATSSNPAGELFLVKGMDQAELAARPHVIICYNNIDHYGNLTSAVIPVSCYEARELGIIRPGKRVMTVAFGGGFSWCTAIIEWGGRHLPVFQKRAS